MAVRQTSVGRVTQMMKAMSGSEEKEGLKDGKVAADRVRVSWGKVDNFKCVDFFQIEYYENHDPVNTVQMTDKINKNRKSFDIDIKPCSDYRFKVDLILFLVFHVRILMCFRSSRQKTGKE